jgi:Tfp pilus assembly protein PilX
MRNQPIRSAREGQWGFALISALLVVLLASILGATFMSAVTGERSMSSNVHVARGALLSADAGVRVTQQTMANMAKAKLDSLVDAWSGVGPIIANPQNLFPAGVIATSGTNPSFNAQATIAFTDSALSPSAQFYDYTYTTNATGAFGAAGSRSIQTTGILRVSCSRGSFADFLVFTNVHLSPGGNPVWFTSNTRFDGRVHTNGEYRFAYAPQFQDLVTSVDNEAWYNNSGSPIELDADNNGSIDVPGFFGGFDRAEPPITLPPNSYSQQNAALGRNPSDTTPPSNSDINTALGLGASGFPPPIGVYVVHSGSTVNGGIYIQGNVDRMAASVDAYGRQVYALKQGPTTTTITVDKSTNSTRVAVGASWTDYTGVPLGIAYVKGMVVDLRGPDRVGGSPPPAIAQDTQLLLAATGDVVIQRDFTYAGYPNSQNVFGIYSSGGSVRVGSSAPDNMNLDAFVMATGATGSFTVDNYSSGSSRGQFNLRGGMVENYYGAFGTFNTSTGHQATGYGRNFMYDRRGLIPPYYPVTNRFTANAPSARTLAWREL